MYELKDCPFCGNKYNEGHKETCYFRSRNKGDAAREESWQARPIEDALSARVVELETSTYCAYCGEQYPLDDKAASAVSEHIKSCKKHPMRKLEYEWDAKATKYRVERDKANVKNLELREALDEAVTKLSGAPNTNQYEWEHWRVEFCIKHKKGA